MAEARDQLGFNWGGSHAARVGRDEGIATVTENNLPWHDRALALLQRLAGSGREMTGEEMRLWLIEQGLESPAAPHAWGALTRHACTSGLLEDTGTVRQMAEIKSHARRSPVWRFK
jgi:hypothetical protein